MSIALANKNPRLHACVLDFAVVCKIASRNIRRAGLSTRVRTLPGDIRQKLPTGYDVIMFCDIGQLSRQLLRRAYRSLPPGGLVVAVDRYLSGDRTRPLDRLVSQFVGSSFPQTTGSDVAAAISSCGFQSVKAAIFHRDVWCITGRKPGRLIA